MTISALARGNLGMSHMTRKLVVDSVRIAEDGDCYVIAEIGHNHQGDLEKCKDLIRAAKECGANAAKLQKRDNRTLYTKAMYDSPYDHRNSFGATYGEHREFLEFGRDEYVELQAFCRELGITFFVTAFDFASADFLAELDMPAYKISSGDLTNIPLIKYIAGIGKPMFISTGGATMEDVVRAHDAAMPINPQLCIMQCTSGYPADYDQLNLNVIRTFRETFRDLVIGYSGHDNGHAMPLVAYLSGAWVIEKHFTLNRAWKGTDHAFSLAPEGMRRMVRDLHRARMALGSPEKRRLDVEYGPMFKMKKKLVAARVIRAGHVLTREDISIKSPGDGLPPYQLENLLGKTTRIAISEDQNIRFEDLTDA